MNVLALLQFASEETTGIGALGLDVKAMLLQAGTFVILFFIIKKYALESITKNLEDRRKKIEESLDQAHEIEVRSQEMNKETEKLLKKARKDADELIVAAQDESKSLIAEAEKKASKKQDKAMADAEAKLQAEVSKAKEELSKEMLSLVARATETVLGEKLDASKDQQLINQALKEHKSD